MSVLKFMDLRVRNLVYYVKERREAGDFQKQVALENIWATDRRSKIKTGEK
jgi:hypothetical protein